MSKNESEAKSINSDENKRPIVEAFILTGEDDNKIAEYLGINEGIIESYRKIFYAIGNKSILERFALINASKTEDEFYYKTVALKYGIEVLACCSVGLNEKHEDKVMGKIRLAMMEMFFDVNVKQGESRYAKNLVALHRALDKRSSPPRDSDKNESGAVDSKEIAFDQAIDMLAENFKRGMR